MKYFSDKSLENKLDNHNFRVETLKNERLIGTVQGLDVNFDIDMHNYGDTDNLPNSDQIMICQQKGTKQNRCKIN